MALDFIPQSMNSELLAACNALGYLEGSTYQKEPDCLETVKDLIRFLRREDETCEIRRQLGNTKIMQNDLIPLMKQHSNNAELFETCIRLMVNLTQPAELCFNKPLDDKVFLNYSLEILSHLQSYKQAFNDEEFMSVLAKKMKKLLDKDWERRREEHTILMERIMLLVRNILHVPADPNEEKRTDDDASIHDQVLWALNTSGMDKLILYIASAENEQQWCMHAVEIISYMLREQTPEQVVRAGLARVASERMREQKELEAIVQQELAEKQARMLKQSARHSRFGGTFVLRNLKSTTDRDIIYHKAIQNSNNISFEVEKVPIKRPKHRLPMKDNTITRKSTLSIRLFLKEFCELFLENCYNPLMYQVKDHILHQRAQENDDSYYLWCMRFFMEYNRLHEFKVDHISETFSNQTFHYVQMQIIKYQEMLTTDKKEIKNWSKRMHLALKAYRELLMTMDAMANHSNPEIRESAEVVQSNVFYIMEYKEMLLILLKKFDDIKMTATFLQDMIETSHIFLKMLERYCKGKRTIIVQKKGRKKQRRRRNAANRQQTEETANNGPDDQELAQLWDNVASDLSAMLQDREDIPSHAVPFDAASERPVEEQRSDAMIRIQTCLRNAEAGEGLALFRAAREVWPEGNIFGEADIAPEDEFMALREILFTNLNVPQEQPEPPITGEEEFEDEEEEEEEEEEVRARTEEEFHFDVFVRRFCQPDILRNYIKLFKDFRKNPQFTNHCIIKMLHRVAVSCDMAPALFQLSLFRIFQKLLNDPIAKTNQFKELVKFSKFILSKFFAMVPENPKLFMELLFWKDKGDIFELMEGYGNSQNRRGSCKDSGPSWSQEDEDELRTLFDQYRDVEGDKDTVDHIMEHISDESKSRRQIISQLVRQGLVENWNELKRAPGSKKVTLWREEQEYELKNLHDEYKNSDDPLTNILENMVERRSRVKVIEKLLEMNLIKDKSEMYKKRSKKSTSDDKSGKSSRRRKKSGEGEEENFIDNNADEDSDDEPGWEYQEPKSPEMKDSGSSASSADEGGSGEGEDAEKNIKYYVRKLEKKGFSGQLRWIQDGLRITASDRDDDDGDDEAVPLVPLTEEASKAMTDKLFQEMLKLVGMSPPGEQEIYWRISAGLTADQLREIAQSIEPSQKGTQAGEKKLKKEKSERQKKLEEMADKRKAGKTRQRKHRLDMEEVLSEVLQEGQGANKDDGEGKHGAKKKQRSRKKRVQRASSDSESDDEPLGQLLTETEKSTSSNPSKRSRIISDDEDEPSLAFLEKRPSQPAKKSRIQSDDDDDDDTPLIASADKSAKKPVKDDLPLSFSTKSSFKRSRILIDEDDDESVLSSAISEKEDTSFETPGSGAAIQKSGQKLDDSDSDSDDNLQLRKVVRRKVIESDSDED